MIRGELTGDKLVVQSLRQKVPAITQRVERALERLTLMLLERVKLKLSDDVLRVRTGRLRRSVTYVMRGKGTNEYEGIVGTNVSYGKTHELGFQGTANIKEHLRMVKQAWGKSIEPKQVVVRAHTRQVNLPSRSFLRSALKDMEGSVASTITEAVKEETR